MADKVNLQPSILFDHTRPPINSRPSAGATLASTSPSSSSVFSKPSSTAADRAPTTMDRRSLTESVSSLISPPEAPPYESFSRSSPPRPAMACLSKPTYPITLNSFPSPPVSPEQKVGSNPDDPAAIVVKDPILYPNQDLASITSSQPPLFSVEDEEVAHRGVVVDEHMSARAYTTPQFREASPPRRDDYVLALEFKSQVAKLCNENPRQWFHREREYLREDQRIRMLGRVKSRPFATIAPAPSPAAKTTKSGNVIRPKKPIASVPRLPRPPRATTPAHNRYHVYESITPEPGRRQNVGTTREDKDFNALPDYSPPTSTLPNRPNSLKVEWKGAPIDLRNDPYRHLLHEDELILAANLRLDCATYLTSKRRIFIARIECLRIGKEFRKTDSQQACKIDVNKASKLWAAFDKVGWLKPEHFKKYL